MQWYSATQVAALLKVATATIIGQIEDGTLGAVNIARASSRRRRWRISEQHIAEFQERRQNKARPTALASKPAGRNIKRPTHDFFAKSAKVGK